MDILGVSQLLLTRFGLNFKGKEAKSMKVLGKVKAKSRQGQSKVKARSRPGQEKVGASSWQGQGEVLAR